MKMPRLGAAGICCAVLIAAWTGNSACTITTRSCTEVGCENGATVDLTSPNGAWTPGTYELDLVVDGASASCALAVPAAPSPTSAIEASCTSQIGLTFLAETQCYSLPSDGSVVGEGCSPVPGQFHQLLSLPGTPARVALALSRDGKALFDKTLDLSYQDFYPNGPQCGGACREASATVSVVGDVGDGGVESGPALDAGAD
jgi:hypothetical protein